MKLILKIFCLCCPVLLFSQTDELYVGENNLSASAIVEFSADDRGILIPRMTSSERIAIVGPVDGLMVYDGDTESFWHHTGFNWIEMLLRPIQSIEDGDGDTKIWVEKSPNEDILRFDVAGQELVIIDDKQFLIESNADLLIGSSMFGVGKKLFYDSSKGAFRMGEVDATEWDNFLLGQNTFAFGKNTVANAALAAAWGQGNLATASYATAFGNLTDATAIYGASWGSGSQATGAYSTAFGSNSNATNTYASCFGIENTASGNGSTAFGFLNTAAGAQATCFGSLTEANGDNSTAMGLSSKALGKNSTAIGQGAVASSFVETAVGAFNTIPPLSSLTVFSSIDRLFVVGNGSSNTNRIDAFTIQKTGNSTSIGNIVSLPRPSESSSTVNLFNSTNGLYKGWSFEHDRNLDEFKINEHSIFNNTQVVKWDEDGNLHVGSSSSGNKFSVSGCASKATAGAWLANSDRRLKKDIETIEEGFALSQILKMQGVHYEWKEGEDGHIRGEGIQDGFIAQELKKIWPQKVQEDDKGFLQTAYGDYDPMFVESFKAQQELLESLQEEQDALQQKLTAQHQLNSQIKNKLASLQERAFYLMSRAKDKNNFTDSLGENFTTDTKSKK